VFAPVLGVPQLARDPQLIPRDELLLQCLRDPLPALDFVPVVTRTVDQTLPVFDHILHDLSAHVPSDLPDSKADLRHLVPVAQHQTGLCVLHGLCAVGD